MTALVTRQQLEASVRRQLDGPAADEALAEASDIVRDYLGATSLEPVGNEVMILHGTGTTSLLLPAVPTNGVDLVRVKEVGGTAWVALAATEYHNEGRSGILWRLNGEVWPAGIANVEATVDHGHASVPPSARAVVMSLAMRIYYSLPKDSTVRSSQLGAASETRAPATEGLVGLERQILDRLKNDRTPAA